MLIKNLKLLFVLSIFIFFSNGVSHASISILGGLSHSKILKAGESHRGAILIKNNSKEITKIKVYQTDYLFFSDGTNVYGKPGQDKRSNAKWIEFSPDHLNIAPSGIAEVDYTIKAPDDNTLIGTYWSMLMVEEIKEADFDKLKNNQVGISQVFRYGVQMITSIGDTGTANIKFKNLKLAKTAAGKKNLIVDIENVGEKFLALSLWVEMYNQEGKYIGKFENERVRIFPGTSTRKIIELGDFSPGEYKAMIVADAGGDQIFGSSFNLNFK